MRNLCLSWAIAAVLIGVPSARADEVEDNATAHLIAGNLKASGKMHDYEIGVTCHEGTAWLTGQVTDSQQGAAALAIAMETEGVKRVINQLSYDGSEAIQQTSQAAPNRSPRVRHADIQPQDQRGRRPANRPAAAQVGNAPMPYAQMGGGGPMPVSSMQPGIAPARYDSPSMPNYAWPSYAASPNYAGLTYPRQYSPTAWPYIGPFYPYPQVPLGWRRVSLEWDDGWWFLDFHTANCEPHNK